MGEAYFYHLTRQPLEVTAATLLGKALGAGWRCVVVGRSEQRLSALDQALWNGKNTDFLAHGLAGTPQDSAQPILLSDNHTTQYSSGFLTHMFPNLQASDTTHT